MARKSRVSVGDVAEILGAGRESERRRSEEVSVVLAVDPKAPADVVRALRHAFMPELSTSTVTVGRLDDAPAADDGPDLALVVAPGSPDAATRVAETYARRGVPTGIVVDTVLDFRPDARIPEAVAQLMRPVPATSEDALMDNLADWVVSATGEKGIAFAANFPFCRRRKVRDLVRRCALQNAAVGVVQVLPGADFPIMSVNQAKLALDVAACYGRPVGLERAVEVAGVVGLGVVYRQVARAVSGLLPGLGWAVKGGIGYAGTLATGGALALRFEGEGGGQRVSPSDVEAEADARMREAAGRATARLAPLLPQGTRRPDEGYVTLEP